MNIEIKQRNFLVDNAKAICIFFTVFGHFLELFAPYNKFLILIIYTFHMPVFIFFSGYYAKYNIKKILKDFLIPYFFIEILSFLIYKIIDPATEFHLAMGYTSLWYLLSLSWWYFSVKLLDNVKHKKIFILLTIVLALIVGYDSSINATLSLSRTIVFFPIFASGYFLKKINYLDNRNNIILKKIISIILFIGLIFTIYKYQNYLDVVYFYGSYSYYGNYNPIMRLFVYVSNIIGIYFFINVIPNKKTVITYIGRNTFSVYIIHYVLVYLIFKLTNLIDYSHLTILSLLLSINIVWIFAQKYVYITIKNFFDYFYTKIAKFYKYLFEIKK